MRIKNKLILAFLVISLVPLVITGTLSYLNAEKSLKQEVFDHLESFGAIQQARVESIIAQNLERLILISSRTQLRLTLESFVREPKIEYQEKMNRILQDARSSISDFRDISILTLDGKTVVSTDETAIGTKHSDADLFIRSKGENIVDNYFLDENQNLRVYLSGPLYLNNEIMGMVVVDSDADNIISLVGDYSGLGETGHTVIAKREEDGDALFLTPVRFDKDSALRRSISKDDINKPISQALLKNEQLFTDVIDCRGVPVLANTKYIEKTDWGLVVKIDKSEAFASINRLKYILLSIGIITLIAVPLLAFLSSKSLSAPIQKLTSGTEIVGRGGLAHKIDIKSSDEIGKLANSFNTMIGNLQAQQQKIEDDDKKLVESERKFRTLVTNIPGATYRCACDPSWTMEIISDGIKEISGYPPTDFLNNNVRTYTSIIHPEDVGIVQKTVYEGVNNHMPYSVEYRIIDSNNEIHWVSERGQGTFNDKGEVMWLDGTIFTVTDRRLVEIKIQEYAKDLEKKVKTHTKELKEKNLELQENAAEVVRKNTLLNSINKVFLGTITCKTEEDLGKTCLAVAEELTGSKFGFIGELNEKGLFDTIAISKPGWDACNMAVVDARKYTSSMQIRGVDRTVMIKGESRILNGEGTILAHSDHVEAPDGHPPLTAFLGVPLKRKGKTVGMIGLGNKEGGYEVIDQEAAEVLSMAIVEALMSKRAEEEVVKLSKDLKQYTVQLEAANEELKQKYKELEHFNDLFLGRELRIKELREKIKELQGETQT